LGLYTSFYVEAISGENKLHTSFLLFFTYSSIDITSIDKLVSVIFFMLPQVLLVYMLGSSLYVNFKKNTIYVFTRTNSKVQWLLKQLGSLLGNVVLFYIVQFIIIMMISMIRGYHFFSLNDVKVMCIVFLFQVLFGFLLVLLTNFLSFFIHITYSIVIVLFGYIFLMTTAGLIHTYFEKLEGMIKWFPTSQNILVWHDSEFLSIIHIMSSL